MKELLEGLAYCFMKTVKALVGAVCIIMILALMPVVLVFELLDSKF